MDLCGRFREVEVASADSSLPGHRRPDSGLKMNLVSLAASVACMVGLMFRVSRRVGPFKERRKKRLRGSEISMKQYR